MGSLTALRDKNQRTVYRLTLVAGWNAEDAMGYAKLIDLGKPDFIEIKGMTYCGNTSGASNLTMKNVPYHDDVKAFGEALCAARIKHAGGVDDEGAELTGGTPAGAEYGLACEHRHSCCILLARKDPYLVDGKWHTWIDYEKFQDLAASGKPFRSKDYMLPTPHWSVWGAEEAGFDPRETRVRKVRNHPGKNPAHPRRRRVSVRRVVASLFIHSFILFTYGVVSAEKDLRRSSLDARLVPRLGSTIRSYSPCFSRDAQA